MKVCSKLQLVLILSSVFLFSSCNKKDYSSELFYPCNNRFVFDSLAIKHPEMVKTVIQSNGVSETRNEYENGKIIKQSDCYLKEITDDYPPNFVSLFEYDKNDNLIKEIWFISSEQPENLFDITNYVYDKNKIIQNSNNEVQFIYTFSQKRNGRGYQLLSENQKANQKILIDYTETGKAHIKKRIFNGVPEAEEHILLKKGVEVAWLSYDFKNGEKILTRQKEVTEFENDLIKEITDYKVSSNGEKKLYEIIKIDGYDQYQNWGIINIYDHKRNLKKTYSQEIVYLP